MATITLLHIDRGQVLMPNFQGHYQRLNLLFDRRIRPIVHWLVSARQQHSEKAPCHATITGVAILPLYGFYWPSTACVQVCDY